MKLSQLKQMFFEHQRRYGETANPGYKALQVFLDEAANTMTADCPDPSVSFQAFVKVVSANGMSEKELLDVLPEAQLFRAWQEEDIKLSLQPINTQMLFSHLQINTAPLTFTSPSRIADINLLADTQTHLAALLEKSSLANKKQLLKHLSQNSPVLPPANMIPLIEAIEKNLAEKPVYSAEDLLASSVKKSF